MRLGAALLILSLASCSAIPRQRDSRGVSPLVPGGAAVELERVAGRYPEILKAELYFYDGEFSVEMRKEGGAWRADLTPEQVRDLPVERRGFRVYRCRVSVFSRAPGGSADVLKREIRVSLQPPN
jgi:hypothetical protein